MSTRPLLIFACVLSLISVGCGQTPPLQAPVKLPAKAPGKYNESLSSGGHDRTYILHVPPAYDATKPLPLMILLHGLSGSAADIEAVTRMPKEADANGFILVSPNGLGSLPGWNAGFFYMGDHSIDDVAFIDALISRVEGEVGVDPDRVYVAGHSNGAFMANFLAARLSSKIAAIASVSGTIGVPERDGVVKQIPDPSGPVSVLLIHGKADPMVAYNSSSSALLKDVGAMDSAKWWATKDGCSLTPSETSSGNALTDLFPGGKQNTEVELISIANGTHNWPGGFYSDGQETRTGVNATDLIWQFFKAHPKAR